MCNCPRLCYLCSYEVCRRCHSWFITKTSRTVVDNHVVKFHLHDIIWTFLESTDNDNFLFKIVINLLVRIVTVHCEKNRSSCCLPAISRYKMMTILSTQITFQAIIPWLGLWIRARDAIFDWVRRRLKGCKSVWCMSPCIKTSLHQALRVHHRARCRRTGEC